MLLAKNAAKIIFFNCSLTDDDVYHKLLRNFKCFFNPSYERNLSNFNDL